MGVKLACKGCLRTLVDVNLTFDAAGRVQLGEQNTYVQHGGGAWSFPPTMPAYVKCPECKREIGTRNGPPLPLSEFLHGASEPVVALPVSHQPSEHAA